MILSERGAIRAAIADGGLRLYPAGRFIDYIKDHIPGDDLKGDFDPQKTVEKITNVAPPEGAHERAIFEKDLGLICSRLKEQKPSYNIEAIFQKMSEHLPALAKRYYGIETFEPVTPKIVEYYFEGYSDFYKDGDWFAFNVTHAESQELGVPVGTYFKRDQVSPGQPEFVVMHEANHAMQEIASVPMGVHHYVPWLDEGLADTLGRMMLYSVTNDETLLAKMKNFRTEVEVTDPRKVTYHYGAEIAAILLLRGRLPLVKTLLKMRKESPYNFDWNLLAVQIKQGIDPHVAIFSAYVGPRKDFFQKRLTKLENEFRKESDLNQSDLKVLTMFLAIQPPAVLPPFEYRAAVWFGGEVAKEPANHFIDPAAIPQGLRSQIPNWDTNNLLQFDSIPDAISKKLDGLLTKVVIRTQDVPEDFRDGAEALANNYFIIKRRIGEHEVYEPYGGGLPYRLGSDELRCKW